MSKYTFKFKYKNETRYLYLPITSIEKDKAIEEARYFIGSQKGLGKEIEKGRLIKHTERDEIVWGMEKI